MWHVGPARPLGKLGDRLGRQPLRGAKMQMRKKKTEKLTLMHPKEQRGVGVGVSGGAAKASLPRAPKWLGPLLVAWYHKPHRNCSCKTKYFIRIGSCDLPHSLSVLDTYIKMACGQTMVYICSFLNHYKM